MSAAGKQPQEDERIEDLVKRLRKHGDAVVALGPSLEARNASATMYDAAATLVDVALGGEEPGE